MNILLVSASIEDETRSPENPDSHYPLGLGYLHAYLEAKGHEVRTLFLNSIPHPECLLRTQAAIQDFKPALIGFQMISNNRVSSYRLIERIHAQHPGIQLVVGGIHASVAHQQIVEKYPYVIAVIGEGESTMEDLARALVEGRPLESVQGISFHDGQGIVQTPERPLILDLDTLPFPKHEIFNEANRTVANLLTSRGCPFACSFCVLENVSRRRVRYRSVGNVVDEVQHILGTLPNIQHIWIHDDSFFLNNKRVIEFCEEVQRRGIKTDFICSARFKPVSRELVEALQAAGFSHVLFGLESGAEEVLKGTRKGVTKDDARQAMRLFAGTRIKATAFLIIGLPGEDDATIEETIAFIQELQAINYIYYDDIGVLTVYPATEVYELAKQKGLLDDRSWLEDGPVPLYTAEHSAEKLEAMKEHVRDHISLNRITTPKGFLAQRKLLPQIIEYSLRFGFQGIKALVQEGMGRYGILDDLLLNKLQVPPGDLLARTAQALEYILLEAILKGIPGEAERARFLADYKDRVKRDTLRERSRRMQAGL